MKSNLHFDDIDGLVLATIAYCWKNDILSWIEFIDYYYRIIISYDELCSSLVKLQKSGLIEFKDNIFYCKDNSKKLLTGRDSMSVINWIFRVQEELSKLSPTDLNNECVTILKDEYDSQLKTYHSRFGKVNKK